VAAPHGVLPVVGRDPGVPMTTRFGFVTGPNHNANKTHCKYGHPFTPENTMRTKQGHWNKRRCRICHREDSRAWGKYKRRRKSRAKGAVHAAVL
jgi:hypothetical protein